MFLTFRLNRRSTVSPSLWFRQVPRVRLRRRDSLKLVFIALLWGTTKVKAELVSAAVEDLFTGGEGVKSHTLPKTPFPDGGPKTWMFRACTLRLPDQERVKCIAACRRECESICRSRLSVVP